MNIRVVIVFPVTGYHHPENIDNKPFTALLPATQTDNPTHPGTADIPESGNEYPVGAVLIAAVVLTGRPASSTGFSAYGGQSVRRTLYQLLVGGISGGVAGAIMEPELTAAYPDAEPGNVLHCMLEREIGDMPLLDNNCAVGSIALTEELCAAQRDER